MHGKLRLKLVTKDYDHVAPLACGDVVAAGIDLDFERDTEKAIDRTLADPSVDAGEMSLSRHLSRLARGDDSFVGIPIFMCRYFHHRCFFVRRDSGLHSIEQLQGRRIGTNEWPATGHTWNRALLRHHGVRIEDIQWWVGSVDGTPANRSQGELPANVTLAGGRTLLAMLYAGELDALMYANPPRAFYERGSLLVRLIADYRKHEMQYFRETGLFPANHLIGVRRGAYEKNPWVLRSLFNALDEAKIRWQANRRRLNDTTPWIMSEFEEMAALFGGDPSPNGVEPNRRMVQTMCDEQFVQGLNPARLDAAIVFPEFEAVMAA
jgi:4,5-dihydroxyphthalate decarboxylase